MLPSVLVSSPGFLGISSFLSAILLSAMSDIFSTTISFDVKRVLQYVELL